MLKIKIKCTKCNWEAVVEVSRSPLGSLKPGKAIKGTGKGLKVKWTKEQLDKVMDAAGGLGASRDELGQVGIRVPIPQWVDALERRRLRQFVRKHLKVSKDLRNAQGERSQVSTAPWQMGDSFKDVDLASSEIAAYGVPDLRLIPGVTLQKRVFETTKGGDREILRGIKFFNIIDVSGSMFGGSSQSQGNIDKVHKALMMAEETSKICKKLGYDYNLSIFSGIATRIPKRKIKRFFKSETERATYPGWNGGTTLSSALGLYDLKELKDGNLVIMSDMDISDSEESKKKLKEIGNVTSSFKVVIIEYRSQLRKERLIRTRELFPDKKVQILRIAI